MSMWISNTATALIMVPNALAVLKSLERVAGEEAMNKFGIGLFLGIAYSCNIGGIATIVISMRRIFFDCYRLELLLI